MTNGHLKTWQVIRFLSKRSELTAEAPDTDDLFPCTASTDGIHIEFITHFPKDDDGDSSGSPPIRNDWTVMLNGKPFDSLELEAAK